MAGAGLELSDRSLICLPSTFEKDGVLQSRIVPWFGPGAVITTPRHQVDVIVTEYGAAELEAGQSVNAARRWLRSRIHSSGMRCRRPRSELRGTLAGPITPTRSGHTTCGDEEVLTHLRSLVEGPSTYCWCRRAPAGYPEMCLRQLN
ncbi:acetyl-CoA hydrolase [Mycolicibacterium fortuitum]|uniref:Acetyl-CoA hydrolase n=1 Tax=Mycolicibacterium fortuitum TaxID=1766 RepID=A0A378UXC9_MYCFO|nr:acetyl-CoA hydrolase [Mycolicibacterium fortuitum]